MKLSEVIRRRRTPPTASTRDPDSAAAGNRVLRLSERKLNAARGAYNATRFTFSISFDELLELYANPCENFSSIGRRLGVVGERARQIYMQFFVPLFSARPDGMSRRRVCSLKRAGSAQPSERSAASAAIAAAKVAGIEATPVRIRRVGSGSIVRVRSNEVVINEVKCRVVRRRSRAINGSSKHGYFNILLRPCHRSTHLLVLTPLGTFVLPAGTIPADLGTLYIPDVPRDSMNIEFHGGVRGIEPAVNWWDYHERWDLLKIKD